MKSNKEDINILFKQGNTDERILKSMDSDEFHQYNSEELLKAMNRSGLVQKEVQVQGKNGQTFTRKQWVRASDTSSNSDSSKLSSQVQSSSNSSKFRVGQKVKSDQLKGTWEITSDKPDMPNKIVLKNSRGSLVEVPKKSLSIVENSTSNSQHWTKVGTSEQAKSQIAQMLASGKSRDDLMSEFKEQGVTWKESDNAGINWMRAAMAMNKHLTSSGVSEQVKNTDNSVSKERKDASKKPEVKSVVGSDYTQLTTEEESGTIEGEAHNMMVGKLGSENKKKPTEKEIKAAATSLKDDAMKTVISSYNQDTLVHQLAMAKQFTKLAGGNMDYMTLEDIYKDVVSGQGSYTQEQKCNALAKLCGKDYSSYDDNVRRYANNSLASASITPKSKGYFDVTFSYDDGASRTERFDSVKSAKEAADKFIDKEEKYADEKKSR